MSFISYILSEENLNSDKPILVGGVKDYLKLFIHDDGDISEKLNLGNSLSSFNNINEVQESIESFRNNFSDANSLCAVYNSTYEWLQKEKLLKETQLFPLNDLGQNKKIISYFELINLINKTFSRLDNMDGKRYQWNFETENTQCDTTVNDQTPFNPKYCSPIKIIKALFQNGLGNSDLEKYAIIVDHIQAFINNTLYEDNGESFLQKLNKLKEYYFEYLSEFSSTLNIFNDVINNLMSKIRNLIGNNNNIFSFLNGHFIKTNVQIILKNLKDALGKNIFSIGLSLNIVGCVLILSISSTLILLAIINEELNHHIKTENTPGMSSSKIKLNHVSPFRPNNLLPTQ